MTEARTVNVSDIIDQSPLGAAQWRIIVLCGLIALLDGFGLQSIGLAAPSIAAALHIPPQELGAVFSAALAGLAIGAFSLIVGALLAGHVPVSTIFMIIGVLGIVAAITAVLVGVRYTRDERDPGGATNARPASRPMSGSAHATPGAGGTRSLRS